MKKSFLVALILFVFNMAALAQTEPKKVATTAQVVPGKTTAKPAAPIKADGSPDMRYKANREADKTAPKLKKDGTPDKRYSRNKTK